MKEKVDLLIYNIRQIVTPFNSNLKKGKELSNLKIFENCGIAIKDGIIFDLSSTEEILDKYYSDNKLDLKNENILLPGFIDPHTHLLFGGSREDEFLLRFKGESYITIQKKGGGIYKTQRDTFELNEDDLINLGEERLKVANSFGILSIEIKSGYGLDVEKEIKLLKIIKKLKEISKSKLISTFLLHLVPEKKDRKIFINEVLDVIPQLKKENLLDFIDIFIEEGAFLPQDVIQILKISQDLKIPISLHVDQFNNLGGSSLALDFNVKSLSHLDLTKDSEIESLGEKNVVGIIFPLERLIFKRKEGRGREIIDLGMPISISTDFNPGTSPSLNFPLILSLSIIREGLTVEEAINASTINSAFALNLKEDYGSVEKGKKANLIIFSLKNYKEIPYYVGMNFIKYVIINGEVIRID